MKKIALIGASVRALEMFLKPMLEDTYTGHVTPVGIYDINHKRSEYIGQRHGVPVYRDAADMLRQSGADTVLVTTVDGTHHEYIIQALEAGCNVITEKPMTIDAEKGRAILAAERKSGKKVTVTFNYRYALFNTKIKELIRSGILGDVYSVHFEWMLDRNMDVLAHGTSYFRRWNRYMLKSGGLLVHKSTHHFDLVNWWLDDAPQTVSAFGELRRYGKNGPFRGENCRVCNHKNECEFYHKLDDFAMAFYADAEDVDGYYKDGCVFAQDIDIYDTMAVSVRYQKGALLSYSLNAHVPYEGWRLSVNGSKGRLEAYQPESGLGSKINAWQIKLFDLNDNITTIKVPAIRKGHGGGDKRLQYDVFIGRDNDPLGHQAGAVAGMNSIIIGAAGNISIREKRMVEIADLWPERA